MSLSPGDIAALDRDDPLAGLRGRFVVPEGLIYLDGNSLGVAPASVAEDLADVVAREWSRDLIASWNTAGWFALSQTLGNRLAPLIGAGEDEVVFCDNVSINLFKCLHAALNMRPDRKMVVAEQGGFPTDLYIAHGVEGQRAGMTLRLEGRDGAALDELIDEDVAVVLINHVDYKSSVRRDMAALTQLAHDKGALVIWDLCHSAGVMPIDLNGCASDFAVGCSYKYLNAGPGAPAFVHVPARHHEALRQPLTGWWSHAEPFAFSPDYKRSPGIRAMLTGTQPILSMRAIVAALDALEGVDLGAVRAKSEALTDLFIALVEERCAGHGLELVTPREAAVRGSHVSWRHENGFALARALVARGVIGDFRAPDIMRFGFAPLYLRYCDVAAAVDHLSDILETGVWRDPAYARRSPVT